MMRCLHKCTYVWLTHGQTHGQLVVVHPKSHFLECCISLGYYEMYTLWLAFDLWSDWSRPDKTCHIHFHVVTPSRILWSCVYLCLFVFICALAIPRFSHKSQLFLLLLQYFHNKSKSWSFCKIIPIDFSFLRFLRIQSRLATKIKQTNPRKRLFSHCIQSNLQLRYRLQARCHITLR